MVRPQHGIVAKTQIVSPVIDARKGNKSFDHPA